MIPTSKFKFHLCQLTPLKFDNCPKLNFNIICFWHYSTLFDVVWHFSKLFEDKKLITIILHYLTLNVKKKRYLTLWRTILDISIEGIVCFCSIRLKLGEICISLRIPNNHAIWKSLLFPFPLTTQLLRIMSISEHEQTKPTAQPKLTAPDAIQVLQNISRSLTILLSRILGAIRKNVIILHDLASIRCLRWYYSKKFLRCGKRVKKKKKINF